MEGLIACAWLWVTGGLVIVSLLAALGLPGSEVGLNELDRPSSFFRCAPLA